MRNIIERVAKRLDFSATQITGHTQGKHLRETRVGIAFALRHCGLSFPAIGRIMRRDHATIVHNCRVAAKGLPGDALKAYAATIWEAASGGDLSLQEGAGHVPKEPPPSSDCLVAPYGRSGAAQSVVAQFELAKRQRNDRYAFDNDPSRYPWRHAE